MEVAKLAKSTWDYFLEQKAQLERQQFKDNILMEVQFTLKAFQEEMRQEMEQRIKQEVYQQQREQKVEVKIDASEAAKELQKALRFK